MGALTGVLGLSDSENDFVNDVGHALIFDAINDVLARFNAEVDGLFRLFVERKISQDTLRYLKPTGGMAAPITEHVPAAGAGRIGSWDCAFPLRAWGNALDITRWAEAYTTVQQLDAQLKSLMHKDQARLRRRIMIALFEDTNLTWLDPHRRNTSLTIRRLANGAGDSVTYPPVLGSDTEATEDHYLVAGYVPAAITDVNDPLITLRDDIIHHWGGRSARGEDVVVLMNEDAEPYVRLLTDFERIGDKDVSYGADTDLANLLQDVPGRCIGRCDGVWCSVYEYIPAGYMLAVHMDMPPLLMRIDTASAGLGQGEYTLVSENEDHPLRSAQYERRYGFGVGNRLSAAVIELSEDPAYGPPSDYAE